MDPNSFQYFKSYEDLEVHKLMIEDEPRTLAYKNAILDNKKYFKGKVVMDVGCGTGILSIFCAQAGAKKVFAVEASKMADVAREVVKANNFENVIEVIHSRVEDVKLPDNMKVDAIVSEWMGFYLLHEGMLDSVLFARDHFLKKHGELFPESASIYVAPCSVPALYSDWDDKFGVNMSPFARELRTSKPRKPEILTVKPEDLLGPEEPLCWVDVRVDELNELNGYTMEHVVGASKNGHYQGLCIWFECNFPKLSDNPGDSYTILDTSPQSPRTHWQQTVIVLPHPQEVEKGEPIAFKLDMNRAEPNSRRYNIELTLLDPYEIEHPLPCSCHMTKCIVTKTFMNQHAERVLTVSELEAEHGIKFYGRDLLQIKIDKIVKAEEKKRKALQNIEISDSDDNAN